MLPGGRGGSFRPNFTAPGVPSVDYAVGRTSSNQLKKVVISTSTPLAGFSTSSVAIGTGSKVFTINTDLTALQTSANVKLQSAADSANFVIGTVTSLVGTTLTVNVTSVGGSGTYADWSLSRNLPPQCSEDTGINAIRTGSTTANFTIEDWDYRGIGATPCYLQNNKHVLFTQCLFDLVGECSGPIIGRRSASGGEPTFSATYCTFEGGNSSVGTSCLGSNLVTFEYNKVTGWPTDVWNQPPLVSVTTSFRYNRIIVASTQDEEDGVHCDGVQLVKFNLGSTFTFTHNWITMPATTPPGGSGVTAPINLTANEGTWDVPTEINNCIFEGGGYTVYLTNGASTNGADVVIGENVYVGGGAFGPVYPNTPANITGVTRANPAVVTAAGHNLANGNPIRISGVNGMTELNGNNYIVANKTSNTLELLNVDSTNYNAYTSGGSVRQRNLIRCTVAGLKSPTDGSAVTFSWDGQNVTSVS